MNKCFFKIIGGKFRLRKFILDLFPENYNEYDYVEPFCGAANIFFNKKRCKSDWLNDLSVGVYDLLCVTRDSPNELVDALEKIECNKDTFLLYKALQPKDKLQSAVKEFVIRRASISGGGASFSKTFRTRGGRNELINSFKNSIDSIPHFSAMLQGVNITNKDFACIFPMSENYLCYLDPPYFPTTRFKKLYSIEMSEEDHLNLLNLCNASKAKIILSGYNCELYDKYLSNWNRYAAFSTVHASPTKIRKKNIENIWTNF